MRESIGNRTVWALEPGALDNLLRGRMLQGMMPEAMQSFLRMGAAQPEAARSGQVQRGRLAIIPLQGPLSPLGSFGGTSTEAFAAAIADAAADERIGAIVIPIMSPGGMVFGTQEAGDAVFSARQAKPVIAVADKYAFSAAHWIATQATRFYVTPSGQVGSVGVRGAHVDLSGLEGKIGIRTTLIASDPRKIAGHPYAPLSDDDRAEMQAEVYEMAQAFVAAIARGRGIRTSQVSAIHGTGQMFSARRAARAGVTDGIMTLAQVLAKYGTPQREATIGRAARLELERRRAALQRQLIDI